MTTVSPSCPEDCGRSTTARKDRTRATAARSELFLVSDGMVVLTHPPRCRMRSSWRVAGLLLGGCLLLGGRPLLGGCPSSWRVLFFFTGASSESVTSSMGLASAARTFIC